MKKQYILISIHTLIDTSQVEVGKKFLNLLIDFDKRLEPDYFKDYGNEWYKVPYEGEDHWNKGWTMQMTQKWNDPAYYKPIEITSPAPFDWTRKKAIKYKGEVSHSQLIGEGAYIVDVRKKPYFKQGSIRLEFQPPRKDIDYLLLFSKLCKSLDAEYGMLHFFTGNEISRYSQHSPQTSFRFGHISFGSNIKIANLGWANYFKYNFSDSVDHGMIQEISSKTDDSLNGTLLVLSDDIYDVKNDFEDFSKKRVIAKKCFASGFIEID